MPCPIPFSRGLGTLFGKSVPNVSLGRGLPTERQRRMMRLMLGIILIGRAHTLPLGKGRIGYFICVPTGTMSSTNTT